MTTIPNIELIEAADAPLLLRDLYAGGDPGPIVGALAHVPELCESTLPFIGAALGPSAVSFRDKEIAILRTSANLSCAYCTNAHTVVAFESGLSHGEVRALRGETGIGDAFHDERELALIGWIDALSVGSGPIPAHVARGAAEALGEAYLVEVTVTVGATMLLNRFATGLGLPTSEETFTRLADFGIAGIEPTQADGATAPATPVAISSDRKAAS